MQFNLVDEKWIPVKRRDGTPDMISPWEVTDKFVENPVVALNAPRPDFNGALIQFFIGLVQTTAAPTNRIDWKQKLSNPPTPDFLKAQFLSVRDAFDLGGEKIKFMQDNETLECKPKPIGWILIGAPTENTLAENRDHFIKRNAVNCMCPSCCSVALFTMQTNAPMGGPGYRTSIRGGGPLTTIVLGDGKMNTLWHNIWLNVLEEKRFNVLCNSKRMAPAERFPWCAKHKLKVTDQEIHPVQLFWAMPRRIRLDFEEPQTGKCDVCDSESNRLITSYQEVNRGTEYLAPVKHHLSPYDSAKGKGVLVHAGGVGYRHWLGFVLPNRNNGIDPAVVVHEYVNNRQQEEQQFRLWAFGYDMKSMKAQCWYEAKIPLLHVDVAIRASFEDCVAGMIKAASLVAENLRIAIKNSLHGTPKFDTIKRTITWTYRDIKKLPADEDKRRARILYDTNDKTIFMEAESFFWQNTEPPFYRILQELKQSLESGNDGVKTRTAWHATLCREAQKGFDGQSWEGPIEDGDPKRIVIARKELGKFNRSNRVKELLGLP